MDEHLAALLSGNAAHVDARSNASLEAVQDGQSPDVVSVCCSDSRVSQEAMWSVDRPGTHFTPSNIGNQAWDVVEGRQVADGNVLYPVHYCGTETVAVVGHTGCGAVTAAYDVVRGEPVPGPRGVSTMVERLVPVVEDGLADDRVDADPDGTPVGVDAATVRDQLVEYNVCTQGSFLRESSDVPDDVSVYGFVYDLHGTYGDALGRAYLVDLHGETDSEAIREAVSDEYGDSVATLL